MASKPESRNSNPVDLKRSTSLRLSIVNRSGQGIPRLFLMFWIAELDRLAAKRIAPRRYRGRELVIVFLREDEARRLNRSYRGRDYATDVLSFGSDVKESLGELVICPKVIARQAKEHGLLVREELGYMVLHGFLHLLGYEHESGERDAKRMFSLQDRLFARLLKRHRSWRLSKRPSA